ncbi:hypothetical protein ACN0IV_12850 [Trabulsiella odontotermitis]|uniref:hypothetical protein n=1 Tax=Trabulsiella odontotermitis TaxID=379893 RepID=UPI003AC2A0D5
MEKIILSSAETETEERESAIPAPSLAKNPDVKFLGYETDVLGDELPIFSGVLVF